MAERKSSSVLTAPVRGAASVLGRLPGAGTVGRVAEGALDKVGAMSPRSRRLAVYTGAGVLGVAGVVEWPVAATGAAVAWLTQAWPGERERSGRAADDVPAAEPGGQSGRHGHRRSRGEPEGVTVDPDDEAVVWAATHAKQPGEPGHHKAPGPVGGMTPGGRMGPTARPTRTSR
ncbi:hypothetical protein [Streptomyces collinus]|uniref:hypothetical protein n=1 Tax=Streptomyces collinus TaxID=42684 RepID=UPI00294399D8|nr:hypothetical protein [Streptomyces collinus]